MTVKSSRRSRCVKHFPDSEISYICLYILDRSTSATPEVFLTQCMFLSTYSHTDSSGQFMDGTTDVTRTWVSKYHNLPFLTLIPREYSTSEHQLTKKNARLHAFFKATLLLTLPCSPMARRATLCEISLTVLSTPDIDRHILQ